MLTIGLALLYLVAVESAANAHHHEFVLVDNFNCSAYHFSQTNSAPGAAFATECLNIIAQPEYTIEDTNSHYTSVTLHPHLSPRSPPLA